MITKKILAVMSTAAIMTTVLTGCGDVSESSKGSDAKDKGTATSSVTPLEIFTKQGDMLKDIKNSGKVSVTVNVQQDKEASKMYSWEELVNSLSKLAAEDSDSTDKIINLTVDAAWKDTSAKFDFSVAGSKVFTIIMTDLADNNGALAGTMYIDASGMPVTGTSLEQTSEAFKNPIRVDLSELNDVISGVSSTDDVIAYTDGMNNVWSEFLTDFTDVINKGVVNADTIEYTLDTTMTDDIATIKASLEKFVGSDAVTSWASNVGLDLNSMLSSIASDSTADSSSVDKASEDTKLLYKLKFSDDALDQIHTFKVEGINKESNEWISLTLGIGISANSEDITAPENAVEFEDVFGSSLSDVIRANMPTSTSTVISDTPDFK